MSKCVLAFVFVLVILVVQLYSCSAVATGALTVRVAVTYLLKGIPEFGFHMIWWNTLFGWGFGFVLAWGHFLRGKWQKGIEQKEHIIHIKTRRQIQ